MMATLRRWFSGPLVSVLLPTHARHGQSLQLVTPRMRWSDRVSVLFGGRISITLLYNDQQTFKAESAA